MIYTQCANNISPQKCSDCSQDKKCMFNQEYGDGTSIRGTYIEDQVQFGQIESLSAQAIQTIGWINTIQEVNQHLQNLGVMGLKHQNYKYFTNMIDKLTDKHNKSFAICFNKKDAYMSIGLSNGSQSIPYFIDQYQFYTIKVLDIQSEGLIFDRSYFKKVPIILYRLTDKQKSIILRMNDMARRLVSYLNSWNTQRSKLQPCGLLEEKQQIIKNQFSWVYLRKITIILDLGSNNISFNDKQVYDNFQSHFNKYVSKKTQVVVDQSSKYQCVVRKSKGESFFKSFPTYMIQLENGVKVDLQPHIYLSTADQQYYCFPIIYLPESPGIILGTPFMFERELTFDQTNKQILLTENCSYEQMKETLLTAQNITEEQVIDIINDEPKIITQDKENQAESYIIEYLIIILFSFLTLIMILIWYYLRRIKLIKNQQEQQVLATEVKTSK